MSTDTKTPRTDAVAFDADEHSWEVVLSDFARQLETELQAAQAEVARLSKFKDAQMFALNLAHTELTALRAEVVELREDKARLDWLEGHKFWPARITEYGSPLYLGGLYLRAAIDAARKEGA